MSYTVQLRAEIPRHGLKTAEDTSWDFHAAVKTAFAKLHKEVKPMPRGLIRRLLARRGEIGV
jgi:hypothetical protein